MSKCFLSYRHVKPDEEVAHFLEKFLDEHNHNVFLDTQIQIGKEWVKEIERQIKSSDFFIVLLSKDSILSEMVRQEVKLDEKTGEIQPMYTLAEAEKDFPRSQTVKIPVEK